MMRKKIMLKIMCIAIIICFINAKVNNAIVSGLKDTFTNEVIVSEEVQESAEETMKDVESGQDLATDKIIEDTEEIVDEFNMEIDAVVEQENISYDGSNSGEGQNLLGEYVGLTYYSQADSRWADVEYTSTGNSSQTMKTSGCGPTAAAMIVSSSKGSILPTTIAELFVNNGYRTANSGTAWSAFSFIADYFGFNEYYTSSSLDTALSYLNQKNDNGTSKYYIVASCGSGLFTSSGHYIVLTAINDNTIQIYDPYLYTGKFTTASRKSAGVVVSGNNVYVSVSNFKEYANYKKFWIFSNDLGQLSTTVQNSSTNNLSYERYVATKKSNLNVRNGNSIQSSVIYSLSKGTKVNVIQISGDWSKIDSPVSGWVCSEFLSSVQVASGSSSAISTYTTGNYKVTASLLNVRTNPGISYAKKTYSKLTANARKQNKALGNYYANGYLNGVICTVTQISGNWGKTASGWICLDYCKKL